MTQLAYASIKDLKTLLTNKKISLPELLTFYVDRSKQINPQLNALLEVFDHDSIMQHHQSGGFLDGIPGAIKNNICQKGRITTCGSKILQDYQAPYNATVIDRLNQQGALILGSANMDEFAMGSSGETSAFGPTKNPWDQTRVPGGSSSGSIAAVAAGMVPWALGTETGGSVRQPAALCGIVGLKPTYGLVSRYGVVAYGSSLDQVGVCARTVHDTALVFSAIAGRDERDSTSLSVAQKDYTQGLDGHMPQGLRIGILESALTAEGMDGEIAQAVQNAVGVLTGLGAQVSKIKLPTFDFGAATYFIMSRAEAASNLARFDGIRYGTRAANAASLAEVYQNTRHDGFGAEVRKRIIVGNYVLSAGHANQYYENAKRVIRVMRQEVIDMFKTVDLILLPTHSIPAFPIGNFAKDSLAMDLQDYFTCPANLVGIPALSVPCGFTKNNLPIGMQFMASHLQEDLLFKVAHAYEQQTAWHTMHPKL